MRIVDIAGNSLNRDQSVRLSSFLIKLATTSFPKILYRRANEDILREKLNLSDDYYHDLNNRLFMVGEKGHVYLNKSGRAISDISDDVFRDIFDRFHKAFTKSKNMETIQFKKKHSMFSSFLRKSRIKIFSCLE